MLWTPPQQIPTGEKWSSKAGWHLLMSLFTRKHEEKSAQRVLLTHSALQPTMCWEMQNITLLLHLTYCRAKKCLHINPLFEMRVCIHNEKREVNASTFLYVPFWVANFYYSIFFHAVYFSQKA